MMAMECVHAKSGTGVGVKWDSKYTHTHTHMSRVRRVCTSSCVCVFVNLHSSPSQGTLEAVAEWVRATYARMHVRIRMRT